MIRLSGYLLTTFLLVVGASLISSGITAQESDPRFLPGIEYAQEIQDDEDASGVAYFPARFVADEAVEILDPAPYSLYMTDADDPGEEIVRPAGELFAPPAGRFRLWLQGEWMMSPHSRLVIFRGRPRPGQKELNVLPVVPAGRVTVAAELAGQPDQELRLLYLGGHELAKGQRQELTRRRTLRHLDGGVLMPEGSVLSAIWDPRKKRYVALSRAFEIEPGKTIPAPLEHPADAQSHLVVYVDRGDALASMLQGLSLALEGAGRRIPPDLELTTTWGAYNVWYDLDPGPVTLKGGNERLYLEPTSLELVGGHITKHEGVLSKQLFIDGEAP